MRTTRFSAVRGGSPERSTCSADLRGLWLGCGCWLMSWRCGEQKPGVIGSRLLLRGPLACSVLILPIPGPLACSVLLHNQIC